MSKFYEKYQNIIDDFIYNNLNYIIKYCINNKLDYFYGNDDHYIDIECFFENLPNNLKDSYEFFLDTVKYTNSYYLKYASDNLKNNYEFILTAVNNNAYSLEFASNNLKNNYDIVLAAVKNKGRALEYASDDLKNNYNIALNAVLHDYNYKVILYLPSKFIKNRKLIVNMNNSKHFSKYYYKRDIIIKILDYKFKIKKNKLKQNLNSIFIFF